MKTLNLKNSFNCLLLFCSIIILLQSCSKSGCTDSTADNYDPDATTSIDNCIPARDKFIAQYSVQEQCGVNSYTYDISIAAASPGKKNVTITNFGQLITPVLAEVNGSLIQITEATYGNVIIAGQGELSGNILVLSYSAIDAGTADTLTCSITATKIQ